MNDIFRLSRRTLLGAGALALGAGLLPDPASAQSISTIKSRGKVLIGIQGDNPPWGFVNTSGASDGFDAVIGKAFADYLGVGVEFLPLAVVNRIPALTTGRVDILFATMAMLPERAKVVQFSKPYVANIIQLVGPKSATIKTNADMKNFTIGVPRASSQDQQVTKNAPEGTTIRRYDDDAATIQALISGQVDAVGGNMFYIDRLNEAKPGLYENKLEFSRLYNGACTRLGDKELNAAANSFVDQIKANGVLKKAYETWMKQEPPASFPDAVEGVPFVAS
jgi:polar amino acid transport system substrate-binding protein